MTSWATTRHSNQLSYTHHTGNAAETETLSFVRTQKRFCPTPWHGFTRRGVVLLGAPAGIRTRDLRLRRPLLYPAELQAQEASSED